MDDFPTLRDLSNHLNYLKENPEAYNAYFDWKRHYRVVTLSRMASPAVHADIKSNLPPHLNPFCNFCQAVNRESELGGEKRLARTKKYRHFAKYWIDEANCTKPSL